MRRLPPFASWKHIVLFAHIYFNVRAQSDTHARVSHRIVLPARSAYTVCARRAYLSQFRFFLLSIRFISLLLSFFDSEIIKVKQF